MAALSFQQELNTTKHSVPLWYAKQRKVAFVINIHCFIWLFVKHPPKKDIIITPSKKSALPLIILAYWKWVPYLPKSASHSKRGTIQKAAFSNDVSVRRLSLLTHRDRHKYLTLLCWQSIMVNAGQRGIHTSTEVGILLSNNNVVARDEPA